ncbi:Uma2 family endonuclease [Kitasatospora sp. NPDC058965]|uniref:Uma2 family endonuclease n=1 Tax=Kitasatospora sp. NPDC058965 TaxID=3346682 RepID=UPI00369F8B6F
MSAMTHERPAQEWSEEQVLLDWFLDLVTPEGFRAELVNGEIVVSPPPDGDHEDYLGLIVGQILRESEVVMQASGHKGLITPPTRGTLQNHVIPDATIAPQDLRLFRGAPGWMEPDGVAMVVEVTSSKPGRDRIAKRHAYASAKIPLYLLVDRELSTLTLFHSPGGDDYTEHHEVAFGEPLPLPAPFGFALDTSPFL